MEYLNLTHFILETPQTGLLKKQSFIYGILFKDNDYCKYRMHYWKRTRLWNNVFLLESINLCKKYCGCISNGKHIASAQKGPSHDADIKYSQNELYVIPGTLMKDIFDSIGRDGS